MPARDPSRMRKYTEGEAIIHGKTSFPVTVIEYAGNEAQKPAELFIQYEAKGEGAEDSSGRSTLISDRGVIEMSGVKMLRCHYFDASALVKLVATDPDEIPGRDVLNRFFFSHSSKFVTSFCMAEAFSAFKAKFVRNRITEDQYIHYVNQFIDEVVGSVEIDEINILSPEVTEEAKRLIQKYKIDFIDCFQIVTILKGTYSCLGPKSKSLLINADRDLAKAARQEGAVVWECTTEPAPQ